MKNFPYFLDDSLNSILFSLSGTPVNSAMEPLNLPTLLSVLVFLTLFSFIFLHSTPGELLNQFSLLRSHAVPAKAVTAMSRDYRDADPSICVELCSVCPGPALFHKRKQTSVYRLPNDLAVTVNGAYIHDRHRSIPCSYILGLSVERADKNTLLSLFPWNGFNCMLSQMLPEFLASNQPKSKY